MPVPTDRRLETSRCILRYPSSSDAARFLTAFASDDFPKDVPLGQVSSLEHVQDWIEKTQARWRVGEGYTWTAERKSDAVPIGQVTLVRSGREDRWALAFWIHPQCWGEGYATEIARRAVEFAFRDLDASTVWAAAATRNSPSLRVLRKLGMDDLGENPEGYRIGEEPIPTREFSIERSTWSGRP